MLDYNLTITNNAVKGDQKNIAFVNENNSLVLVITNNTVYPVTFGTNGECASLKFELPKAIFDNAAGGFTATTPKGNVTWKVDPVAGTSSTVAFSLTPSGSVTLTQSLEIDLGSFKPTAGGTGTLTFSCGAVSMSAAAQLITKAGAVPNQLPLFGASNPLNYEMIVNSMTNETPVFVSPTVTPTSYKVENTIQLVLNFSGANLPPAAKNAHPDSLMAYFDPQNPPYFEVFFPCFAPPDSSNPVYLDLTDAFKIGEPGYNGWTSAWNITCSLDREDVKIQNDFWKIELLRGSLFPIWKVTPLNQQVFSTIGSGNNPGQTLNLFFSHIYSDLPVDPNSSNTNININWYNFVDKSSDTGNSVIVDYSDGGINPTIEKLFVPNIESFELVPESYTAQLAANNYGCTYKTEKGIFAVFPENSQLQFRFRWYITTKGANDVFSVQLSPPGSMSAFANDNAAFVMDASSQYSIDTKTNAPATIEPWKLKVIYTPLGTLVSEKAITPFVRLIDYLKNYLLGRAYSEKNQPPSQNTSFLAFTSPTMAHWNDATEVGGWYNGQWTIALQADGKVKLTIASVSNSFLYDPINDTWTDSNKNRALESPADNWQGLSNLDLRPLGGTIPSLEVLNERLYLAYYEPFGGVKFTSSPDGWNWEIPSTVLGSSLSIVETAPSLQYFNNQWNIAYALAQGNDISIVSSADGKSWGSTIHLNAQPNSFIQMFAEGGNVYVFSDSADGSNYIIFTGNIAGNWSYAKAAKSNVQGSVFINNGLLYVAEVNPDSGDGHLLVANLTSSGQFYNTLSFADAGIVVPKSQSPQYIQGLTLSDGAVAILYRPPIAQNYNSFIKIGTSITEVANAADQSAINYWTFNSSMAFFKNFFFRTRAMTLINYLMTYKSLFNWPQPILGTTTVNASSICNYEYQGKTCLFLAYIDASSNIVIASSANGQQWNINKVLTAQATAVELFSYNWQLWLTFVNKSDQRVYTLNSTDGTTWSGQSLVSNSSQTTTKPALVNNLTDVSMYLAIVDNNKVAWYQYTQSGQRFEWVNVSAQANNGLDNLSVTNVALTFYNQSLYLATVDTNNNIAIFTTSSIGNQWTPLTNFPSAHTDHSPEFVALYNQLLLVYRDNTDQNLKMLRSANGQYWTPAQPLYTTINGSPSMAMLNGSLYLALETGNRPNMVSLMNTSGLIPDLFLAQSSMTQVSELVDFGLILSSYAYWPVSGNPANAALYLLTYQQEEDEYFIYVKKTVSQPLNYKQWEIFNKTATPNGSLPNPKTGYKLKNPFLVLPNGAIIVTASKTDLASDELWYLDVGSQAYDYSFGAGMIALAFNEKLNQVYGASANGGIMYRTPGKGAGNWQRLDSNSPGGNSVNIQIAANEVLTPTFGYSAIPCGQGAKASSVSQLDNNVSFINTLSSTVYYTSIDVNGNKTGSTTAIAANEIASGISAKTGAVWMISSDSAGNNCMNYFQLDEVPFTNIAILQDYAFAIQENSGGEGQIYYWNNAWKPIGARAVAICTDNAGNLFAASAEGQISKVSPSEVGGALSFTFTKIGDTFLDNITSIQSDEDGVLWVLTSNGSLFRQNLQRPVASDPNLATCVFQNFLYLAYRTGEDVKIIYSQDGVSWSDPVAIGVEAIAGPSLSQDGQNLYMAYISPYNIGGGVSNAINVKSSFDGFNWQQGKGVYTNEQSANSPAFRFENSVYDLCFTSNDPNQFVLIASSVDGENWSSPSNQTGYSSEEAISLCYFSANNTYYLAFSDKNSKVLKLVSSTNKGSWQQVNIGGDYTTNQKPVVAIFNNKLVVGYVDGNGNIQLLYSNNGSNWSKYNPNLPVPYNFSMEVFLGEGDSEAMLYLFFVDGNGEIRTRSIRDWATT